VGRNGEKRERERERERKRERCSAPMQEMGVEIVMGAPSLALCWGTGGMKVVGITGLGG
jgi:hypothetical protein